MGMSEQDQNDITLVKSNKRSEKILKTLEKKDHWLSKPFLERQSEHTRNIEVKTNA